MLRDATFKARAIAVAGFTAVAVVGVALWQTDLLVARGFGKALEGARPTLSFQPTAKAGQTQTVAGDEGYWLTRAEVESPTPFAKPLALGDRITIAGRDGRAHQLEIVDLKAVGTTIPVATGSAHTQPRLLIVTCRLSASPLARARVQFASSSRQTRSTPAPWHLPRRCKTGHLSNRLQTVANLCSRTLKPAGVPLRS